MGLTTRGPSLLKAVEGSAMSCQRGIRHRTSLTNGDGKVKVEFRGDVFARVMGCSHLSIFANTVDSGSIQPLRSFYR
jgi:hypothetical protein